jgi:hypothetical protein
MMAPIPAAAFPNVITSARTKVRSIEKCGFFSRSATIRNYHIWILPGIGTSGTVHSPPFAPPPRLRTSLGDVRRVGIEIEFGGPGVAEAAAIVRALYGGDIAVEWGEEGLGCRVAGTALGDFRVELDSAPLLAHRLRSPLGRLGLPPRAIDAAERWLARVAAVWVPREIVSPPVPIPDLGRLEPLREALYAHRAAGTRASPLYSFAFQLNPEVPALDATSLRAHLQAFLLLYEWLVEVADLALARRLGPFIDPFPEAYRRRVVDPAYAPDLDALVDDYLASTPTRNRPLDMLPVFAWLFPERVAARAREPDKLHPRPAFHYRLPNSLVDDRAWSFAREWNRWVEVERLAADDDARAALGEAFLARSPQEARERGNWSTVVARARGLSS